ncbi:MAG TPA: hypothetical protein VK905_01750 [Bacillota bacterium]|nr:hypothetical protein [Bacillota bacterium]
MSVVGLAKNAGKTVALNSILRQAKTAGMTLGLSSIGYDGEKVDILTRLNKPRIYVPAGTLLATATATVARATAKLEIAASTPYVTALGEVIIARVREAGEVEIAGPDSLLEMSHVVRQMQDLAADLVVVDGALDRVGSAAPTVTDATLLATGATVGNTLPLILTRTLHKVALFTLPAALHETQLAALLHAQTRGCLAHLDDSGSVTWMPFSSAMGHSLAVAEALPTKGSVILIIPGAVTDSLVSEICRKRRLASRLTLLTQDPTHIFVTPEVWQRYISYGGKALVSDPIKLLAVSVNPTAPAGSSYEPRSFAATLARSLAPIPVYDLFMSDEAVAVE